MKIDPHRRFGARECPGCAVEVPENNNRCPICGYDFPHDPPHRKRAIAIITLILLGCFLLFYLRLL